MDNYPLFSIQFIFFSVLFLISIYCSWYLPGRLVIGIKEKNSITRLLLSLTLGMVMWGIQGYIFGYLHLRFLTYIYVLLFIVYFWKKHKLILKELIDLCKKSVKENKFITTIIFLGLGIQLLPVANSGFLYTDGVHFSGVNAFDGVMHLAFIRSIVDHFPPVEPGAFDHPMTNYHYWSDLMIAELVRIWHLPIAHTFFQFFPSIVSMFTGIAAYKIVRIFGFSKVAGFWSLFFNYFAADASYLLILIVHKSINFSAPAIDNGVTQFLNMPHAVAKLIFLCGLITFFYWLKIKNKYWGAITVLFFSVLVGTKIYFGLFAFLGFFLVITTKLFMRFYSQYKESDIVTAIKSTYIKERVMIVYSLLFVLFAAIIYFPPNKSSGGLGFYPLEWAKIFIGPGILNWGDWWLRHQEYEAHHNLKGIVFLDSLAIMITLISIHGTRIIGLIPSKYAYKKLGWEMLLFFLPGIILFHFLGLYTLQVSGGLNVHNFFVVSTVVMSLLSAMVLDKISLHKKNVVGLLLVAVVILITVPRTFHEISYYFQKFQYSPDDTKIISHGELQALAFIRNNTPRNAIIQSHPENPYDKKTPYMSYFSQRLTYLTGVGMQESHNQPLDEKKKTLTHLFASNHPQTFATDGLRMGISYLYIRKVPEEKLTFSMNPKLLNPVFENDTVVIYKLQL